jgi:hypothetical protein
MCDNEEIIEIEDLGARYYHEYCQNETEIIDTDPDMDNPLDEVYHDIKANEDTADYMEEFSKIKQQENHIDFDADDIEDLYIPNSSNKNNHENSEDEDEDEDEDNYHPNHDDFETMEITEIKYMCLKMLEYIQNEEDKIKQLSENPLLYQFTSCFSHSTWETDMNSRNIIFSSFITNRFMILLSLFLYKMIYNSNYESFDELRKKIIENVIQYKNQSNTLKQKFEDIHILDIYSKDDFQEISIPVLLHLIFYSEFLNDFDFVSYKMYPELSIMIMESQFESLSNEYFQYPINDIQIVHIEDLIHMYQM